MPRHRPTTRTTNRPSTRPVRAREDTSQMPILGACLLGVGILAALGVALFGTNETHPVMHWLPWAPIVIGLALLVWSLARVGRTAPGRRNDALEGPR